MTATSESPRCPDCDEIMVKAIIECDDKSGWYSAWLCECLPKEEDKKPPMEN